MRQIMRTTLNLDGKAVAGAMRVAPGKSKTDVINEALREYAAPGGRPRSTGLCGREA
jgi:Arc/MetJ family transcription regulator